MFISAMKKHFCTFNHQFASSRRAEKFGFVR